MGKGPWHAKAEDETPEEKEKREHALRAGLQLPYSAPALR